MDNKIIFENSKRLNILYVEDDVQVREATSSLLEIYFNFVDLAVDGESGLQAYTDYYQKTDKYYDVVMSDIKMPKLDGIEMAKKIKAIHSEQAIIFVTAYTDFDYLNAAIELGVDGFLKKPLEVEQLKNILYKTSQKVVDKIIAQEHYAQIEEVNMRHIDLIDAKEFNVAKDILDDLERNKEKISHIWCDKSIVIERLENHEIDVEYFRSNFGIKVIEYFLGVISCTHEAGNCPVVFIMLDYFKHKNLPLDDIFMICVHFKNSMTSYIFSRYSFNQQLFDDVSLILDKNFEGVVRNYLDIKGCTKKEDKKKQNIKSSASPKAILKEEAEHITSYVEYVLEHDVYELQDLEEDIDTMSIKVTDKNKVTVDDIVVLGLNIKRYGSILSNYHLFAKLGVKISLLGSSFQENAEILYVDDEKRNSVSTLLEAFVNDLIVWRREIFENNIENSHFLDASFFSNVDTIIMFMNYDETAEVESEESDIDFFDF